MLLMENKKQPVYVLLRTFLVLSSILFFCSSATATFNNALKLYEKRTTQKLFTPLKILPMLVISHPNLIWV